MQISAFIKFYWDSHAHPLTLCAVNGGFQAATPEPGWPAEPERLLQRKLADSRPQIQGVS